MDRTSIISESNFADIMGVSLRTVSSWETSGKYKSHKDTCGNVFFHIADLMDVPEISEMVNSPKHHSHSPSQYGLFWQQPCSLTI